MINESSLIQMYDVLAGCTMSSFKLPNSRGEAKHIVKVPVTDDFGVELMKYPVGGCDHSTRITSTLSCTWEQSLVGTRIVCSGAFEFVCC